MVKVCHIMSGDLWAGAEVMAFHLLKALRRHEGLDLSVIILNEGRLADEIRNLGIKLQVVDESRTPFYKIVSAVRGAIDKIHPHVVHSHRYKENIIAYLASRAKDGVRLMGTQHGMPEVYGGKLSLRHTLVTKLNFWLLSRKFHRVIAVSEDMREELVGKYGFPKDKVKVIHNGIETTPGPVAGKRNGTFVIGSAGRFHPVKDYPFMVNVALEVFKKTDGIRFELAGDGPEMEKVRALVAEHGIGERFVLRGFLADTSSFYQGLDLYLNTSFHEGLPMSVLEAMSHGLPVIAPRAGGLKEVIRDGREGYVLEARKPEDYADKCIRLSEDVALWERMSLAAREAAEMKFPIENTAQQYLGLYLE